MLEEEISKLQQESGYPYIVNIDTVNASNPIKGKIVMSNLCSEILQVQEPSVINDEQEYVKLGRDISCNLGSTNIANLMKAPDFGRSVKTMVKALTEVSDESNIKSVPSVAHGNEAAHAIGLGAMGLHSFLAQNKIRYGSKEALEFVSTYFMLLNYWTLIASNEIAIEKKQMFDGFLESGYADGSYFEEYENADSTLHFSKTKELLQRNLHSERKRLGQTAPKRNETRIVQSKQARRCANRIDFLHQRHDRIPSADRQGRGRAAGKEDRQDLLPGARAFRRNAALLHERL